MKIVICASIEFAPKIGEVRDALRKLGHEVSIPFTSQRIIDGELTVEEFKEKKNAQGDRHYREFVMMKIKDDLIRRYYNII